jgi:hypothetical protein
MSRSSKINNEKLAMIQPTITFSKTFRFVAGSAVNTTITSDMMKCLLAHSTAANSIDLMIDSYRINNVSMKFLPAIGTSSSLTLEWEGGQYSRSIQKSDTSLGIHPAVIQSGPPRGSGASFWFSQASATANLFKITCPSGTVIDVNLSIGLVEGAFVTTAPTTALTSHVAYVKYLDGVVGGAAGVCVPQGYAYTFAN